MRVFLRQFLLYSRSERRAVVALVLMIILVLIIPGAYRFYHFRSDVLFRDTAWVTQFARLQSGPADTSHLLDAGDARGALFFFDPNAINANDWLRLGLSVKQAAVIEKYKAKGGRFYRPEDLRKIYVLSDTMKDLLIPWVRITDNGPWKRRSTAVIEINTADSAAFETLYGIGPARSARIVKFRKLLGGFYSVAQIAETYGLPDSIFLVIRPQLRVNAGLIAKIDINSADYEVLRKHPYIRAKIAHAIISYRNKNGRFDSLEQLRALRPVTDQVYNKIVSYLKVSE